MVAYSSGSLAAALAYQAFGTYVMFFYLDVAKLSPALYGLGFFLYGLWNAINDPLLGQLSDRTRTRWGRRTPYIALGALPLAFAFYLVWTPPFGPDRMAALFAYFLGVIFVFDTLFSLVILNWTALFPEIARTLRERAEVAAWREAFSIIGLILGIALPPVIYEAWGWRALGMLFGLLTAASLAVAVWGGRERPEFSRDRPLGLREALSHTVRNHSFVTIVLANTFIQFAFVVLTATVPFYVKYVLGGGAIETSIMLGATFVMALPMVYGWAGIAVRRGARWALMASTVLFALALIPFAFVRTFVGGMITTTLMGAGLAGLIVLVNVLIADVCDEDELRTGTRREGMYFGINGLFIRLAISLQALVVSGMLHFGGYDAYLPTQPAGAILAFRVLMTAIPIAALALSWLCLKAYPLHGERLDAVRSAVERLHAKKAAQS
jgi:GPH family glycoside/pentoside/hexuronide:cation symporter